MDLPQNIYELREYLDKTDYEVQIRSYAKPNFPQYGVWIVTPELAFEIEVDSDLASDLGKAMIKTPEQRYQGWGALHRLCCLSAFNLPQKLKDAIVAEVEVRFGRMESEIKKRDYWDLYSLCFNDGSANGGKQRAQEIVARKTREIVAAVERENDLDFCGRAISMYRFHMYLRDVNVLIGALNRILINQGTMEEVRKFRAALRENLSNKSGIEEAYRVVAGRDGTKKDILEIIDRSSLHIWSVFYERVPQEQAQALLDRLLKIAQEDKDPKALARISAWTWISKETIDAIGPKVMELCIVAGDEKLLEQISSGGIQFSAMWSRDPKSPKFVMQYPPSWQQLAKEALQQMMKKRENDGMLSEARHGPFGKPIRNGSEPTEVKSRNRI